MKQLVLLHGALGSKKHFDKISVELSNHYELFSFDFSGHGENNLHQETLSIELFTKDLRNFITSNNLKNPDIFGYSMGGYVALNLALQEPDLMKKYSHLLQNLTGMLNLQIVSQKCLIQIKSKRKYRNMLLNY